MSSLFILGFDRLRTADDVLNKLRGAVAGGSRGDIWGMLFAPAGKEPAGALES